MIPGYVEKWLSDPAFGADLQDFDLSLAQVEFLPRLRTYLSDPAATEPKRVDVISAMLEILEHDCPKNGGPESARLAEEIRQTIRSHAPQCNAALVDLGPVKEIVLRRILGLSVPSEYPKWMIDRAIEEEGA